MSRLPFLEERISDAIRMGTSWGEDFNVEITRTASEQEYRRLVHPFPVRRGRISYTVGRNDLYQDLLSLYRRAYGKYAGWRVQAIDDYTTNGMAGVPTAFDQTLALVSTGVYQLQKAYNTDKTAIDVGFPIRTLYKPVANTTLIGIANPLTGNCSLPANAWTVDTTSGQVTFATDKTANVTNITQAASAVLTIGAHTFAVGDSAYIGNVVGMTQINGRRALVTAISGTTITVAINSTAFSAYTSGGVVHTRPQAGETVKGGCYFDLPCRFDSVIDVTPVSPSYAETGEIEIVELIDP